MDFRHSEDWRVNGKQFLVEIHKHMGPTDGARGPYRWAIYCYLYPGHKMFQTLFDLKYRHIGFGAVEELLQLPLHYGVSCYNINYDCDGVITSFKIGADYDHLHDTLYTHMSCKDVAVDVFRDAEVLFHYLENHS